MTRRLAILLLLIGCCGPLSPVVATIEAHPFPDDELRSRYHALIAEIRCPQCLNTNLAGSDAMIAQDLRREVHRMLIEGYSDEEILDFLFERYGDFVLYKPRVTPRTILLWALPILLFGLGAFIFWKVTESSSSRRKVHRDLAEEARLQRLLSDR